MVHFFQIFGPQKVSWLKSTPNANFDHFFGTVPKFCILRAHFLYFQFLGVSRLGGPDCQKQLGGDFSRKSILQAHFRHFTFFGARVVFKYISFNDLDRQFESDTSLGQRTNDFLIRIFALFQFSFFQQLITQIISGNIHQFGRNMHS